MSLTLEHFYENGNEIKLYIFARYFGLQNKPSSGAKKEKWIQLQDDRYIYEFEKPIYVTVVL